MNIKEEQCTLDKLYHNSINQLDKQEENQRRKYLRKIESYKEKVTQNISADQLVKIHEKIENYEKKLDNLNQIKNKYLLENYDDLFNYFTIKQDIEKNNNPKKLIHNFFNKKKNDELINDHDYNNSIEKYIKKNNFELYSIQYMNKDNDEIVCCTKCNQGELITSNHDGIMICNHCHVIFKYLISNDKPSYKEPPKEISFYAYRRINHFKEILAQFQAKESTDIPPEIIENIRNQIKKERININSLSNRDTKNILKKLKYNKYYEHIPFIKEKLGVKPPIMSPQLEDTLCNLFIDIQIPYAKFCPVDRVNFLNYYYTLYKLCELLGEKTYLPHFPMLKEQKKIEQDDIWKKICKELDWDFIPTL